MSCRSVCSALLSLAVLSLSAIFFEVPAPATSTGAEAGEEIRAVKIVATGSRYEHQQHVTPYSGPRHVSDYAIEVTWNPGETKAREEWSLNTIYPYPNDLTFRAVYHETSGERSGRDGFRPSGDGAVPPARIGAVFKDLWLSNPTILLNYATSLPATTVNRDNKTYERRLLSAHGTQWTMLVDPATGLPEELSTLELDPLEQQVNNRIVFSYWRDVSGTAFPFRLEQYIDDNIIRREIRQSIVVNPTGSDSALELSRKAVAGTDEELRRRGWSMSNFYLRRMALGAPADEDQSDRVEFSEVGEGVYQVLGSSHHNLLVEGSDALAIVDAVWYPQRSVTILHKLRKRWPKKSLKYVILTHHHLDHIGGVRPFVDAGATVVTSESNTAYLRNIFSGSPANLPTISGVGQRATLRGIGRDIELFNVLNSHSANYLAVFVPDEQLLFNADLYSPGAPFHKKIWAKELLDAVRFHDVDVEVDVGAHSNGPRPHQELVDLFGSP